MEFTVNFRIASDDNYESPREWDNLGKIVHWHRRYNLGEAAVGDMEEALVSMIPVCEELDRLQQRHEEDKVTREDYIIGLEKLVDKYNICLPIYMYDHSGVTINTTGFACGWDSGQVGFIYASAEDCRREFGRLWRKKAERCLKGEIETYDQFLRGEVYWFCLEVTGDIEEEDSCGGFYGSDIRTNGMLDHIPARYHPFILEEY